MGKGRPVLHGAARGGAGREPADARRRATPTPSPTPGPVTTSGSPSPVAACSTSDDSSPDKSRAHATRGIRRYYRRKNVARCVIRKRVLYRVRESDSEREEDDSSEQDTNARKPALALQLSRHLSPLRENSAKDLEGSGRTENVISPRASKRRRRSLDKQWVAGGEGTVSATATPESVATSEDEDIAIIWEDTSMGEISVDDEHEDERLAAEGEERMRKTKPPTEEERVEKEHEPSTDEYATPSEDDPVSVVTQHTDTNISLREIRKVMSTDCNSKAPQGDDKSTKDLQFNHVEKIAGDTENVPGVIFSLEYATGGNKQDDSIERNRQRGEEGKCLVGKTDVEEGVEEVVVKYGTSTLDEITESEYSFEMEDEDTEAYPLEGTQMNHISGDHAMESCTRNAVRQPVPPPPRGRSWHLGRLMSRREAALLRSEAFVRHEATRRDSASKEVRQAERDRRVLSARVQNVIRATSPPTTPQQDERSPSLASTKHSPYLILRHPAARRIFTPSPSRHMEAPSTGKRPMTEPCQPRVDFAEKHSERRKSGIETIGRYGSRPSSRDSIPITAILPPRRHMEIDPSLADMYHPILEETTPSEQGNQLLFGSRSHRLSAPATARREIGDRNSPRLGRRPGISAFPFTATMTPLRHSFSPMTPGGGRPRSRGPMLGGCMRAMTSLGHRSLQTAFAIGNGTTPMILVGPRDIDTSFLMRGTSMPFSAMYTYGSADMCLPLVRDINHVHVSHGDVQPEIVEIHTNPHFTDRPSPRVPTESDIRCSMVLEKPESLILNGGNDPLGGSNGTYSWKGHGFLLSHDTKPTVEKEKKNSQAVYCKQCNKGNTNQKSKKIQTTLATDCIQSANTRNDNPRKKRRSKETKERNRSMKDVAMEKKDTCSVGTSMSGELNIGVGSQADINKDSSLHKIVSCSRKRARMTDDKSTSMNLPLPYDTPNQEHISAMTSEPSTETTDSRGDRPYTPTTSPINAVVPNITLQGDISTFCSPTSSAKTSDSSPATPNSPENIEMSANNLLGAIYDTALTRKSKLIIKRELDSFFKVKNDEAIDIKSIRQKSVSSCDSGRKFCITNVNSNTEETGLITMKLNSSESRKPDGVKTLESVSFEIPTSETKIVQQTDSKLGNFLSVTSKENIEKEKSGNELSEPKDETRKHGEKTDFERYISSLDENTMHKSNTISMPPTFQSHASLVKNTEDGFYNSVARDSSVPRVSSSEITVSSSEQSDSLIDVTPIRVYITPLRKTREITSASFDSSNRSRGVSTKTRTASLGNVQAAETEKTVGDVEGSPIVAPKSDILRNNLSRASAVHESKSTPYKKTGTKSVASLIKIPCSPSPKSVARIPQAEKDRYNAPLRKLLFVKCAPESMASESSEQTDPPNTLNKETKLSNASDQDKSLNLMAVRDAPLITSSSSASSFDEASNCNEVNITNRKEKPDEEKERFGTPPKHIGRLFFSKSCNTRDIGLGKSKTEPDISKTLNESRKDQNNKGNTESQNSFSSNAKVSETKIRLKNPKENSKNSQSSKSQKEIPRNQTDTKGSGKKSKEQPKQQKDTSKGEKDSPINEKMVNLHQKMSKDNKKQKETTPNKNSKDICRDKKTNNTFLHELSKNLSVCQEEIKKVPKECVKINKETKEQKGTCVSKSKKDIRKSEKEFRNTVELPNKPKETSQTNDKGPSKVLEREVAKVTQKNSKFQNENSTAKNEEPGVQFENQNTRKDVAGNNKDITKSSESMSIKTENLMDEKTNTILNNCPVNTKSAIRRMFLPKTENVNHILENHFNLNSKDELPNPSISRNDSPTRTTTTNNRNPENDSISSGQMSSNHKQNLQLDSKSQPVSTTGKSISTSKLDVVKWHVAANPSVSILWKEENKERKRVRFSDDQNPHAWDGFVKEWVRDVSRRMGMSDEELRKVRGMSSRMKQSLKEDSKNEEVESLEEKRSTRDVQKLGLRISETPAADKKGKENDNEITSILKKRESSETIPQSKKTTRKAKRRVKVEGKSGVSEENRKEILRSSESVSLPVSKCRRREDTLSSQTEGSLKGVSAKRESILAGKDCDGSVRGNRTGEPTQKPVGRQKPPQRIQTSVDQQESNKQNNPEIKEVKDKITDETARRRVSRKLGVKSAANVRTAERDGTDKKGPSSNATKATEEEPDVKKGIDEASCTGSEGGTVSTSDNSVKVIRPKKRNAKAEIVSVVSLNDPVATETSEKCQNSGQKKVARHKTLVYVTNVPKEVPSDSSWTTNTVSRKSVVAKGKRSSVRKKKSVPVQSEGSVDVVSVRIASSKSFKERVSNLPEWKGVVPGGVDPFPGRRYRYGTARRKSPSERHGHSKPLSLKVHSRGLNVSAFGHKVSNRGSDVSRRTSSLSTTSRGSCSSALEIRQGSSASQSPTVCDALEAAKGPSSSESLEKRLRKTSRKFSMGRRKSGGVRAAEAGMLAEAAEGLHPPRRHRARKRSASPSWV